MLRRFERDDPLRRLVAVATAADVLALQRQRAKVRVGELVRGYLLDLVRSIRGDSRLLLGASPRAALALHWAIQARALLDGRDFALPDDVKLLAGPVLAHRLILTAEARLRGDTAEGIVAAVVDAVAVPVEDELVG